MVHKNVIMGEQKDYQKKGNNTASDSIPITTPWFLVGDRGMHPYDSP